jgi:hypothetical protein
MQKEIIQELVNEIEIIEQEGIELFKRVPLKPAEQVHVEGKEEVVVLRWFLDEDTSKISRNLRRRYDAWYYASLKIIEQYLPYQVEEFKSSYEIMISYVTLNRYAATSSVVLAEVNRKYPLGYVDVYLAEFPRVIDVQANLIRSVLHLPEETMKTSYRCFLTGFPAPYELRENPNLVFVIMPFSKSFDDVYQLGIKETAQSLGLQCKRSDEIIHTQNVICTAICQPIRAARYVIADITGCNPNVFYELGMTHARSEDPDQKNKHVILITQKMEDVPFDIRNLSVIHYESIGSLKEKLRSQFSSLMGQFTTGESH